MFRVDQVTPLLKKPGAEIEGLSNFLPLTNLNMIGEILKRLTLKQLRRHIESSPYIGPLLSAYRALHSTETAMTKIVSDLLTAADSKYPFVLLSLDISAALESVSENRASVISCCMYQHISMLKNK